MGRELSPAMPWKAYRKLTDEELKAIFAYLKSLPPIDNAVPDLIPPAGDVLPTTNKSKQ
jgi:mono/diheme cytochrome c family protein